MARSGRRRWGSGAVGAVTALAVVLPCGVILGLDVLVRHIPLGEAACASAVLRSAIIGGLLGVTVYTGLLLVRGPLER
jgi:hypothetical protein